jgi:hypothetical protein
MSADPYDRYPTHTAGIKQPKVKRYLTVTNTNPNTPDQALQPEVYRWFRKDEKVRRCIIINAAFAILAAGFETELEPTTEIKEEEKEAYLKKFGYVKTYVDTVNRQVNLDEILFKTQIKRPIYGKAVYEIVYDKNGSPEWLRSVKSTSVKPKFNETSQKLENYEVSGETTLELEETLCFLNLDLEGEQEGLSDIEPIIPVCEARHNLLKKDFPKITKRAWAPFNILQADTSGMEEKDEDEFLQSLCESAEAGESMGINKSVTATVVDPKINFTGLIALMDKLEEIEISQFGTPRFLLNKPIENRATALTEFEAYIKGTIIALIQRPLKRDVEAQWYPALVKKALDDNGFKGDVPVRIKHNWKVIRFSDVYEMASAVSTLYSNGLGILGDFKDIAFDMMGWDKKRLQEEEQKLKEQPKTPEIPENKVHKTEKQEEEETVTEEDKNGKQ